MPPKKNTKKGSKAPAEDDDFDALCSELNKIDTTGRAAPTPNIALERKAMMNEARKRMAASEQAGGMGGMPPMEPPAPVDRLPLLELEEAVSTCQDPAAKPFLSNLLDAKQTFVKALSILVIPEDYDHKAFIDAVKAGQGYHLPSKELIDSFKLVAQAFKKEPLLAAMQDIHPPAVQKLFGAVSFLVFEDTGFSTRHKGADIPAPRFSDDEKAKELFYSGSLSDALFVQAVLFGQLRGPLKAAASIPDTEAASDPALADLKAVYLRAASAAGMDSEANWAASMKLSDDIINSAATNQATTRRQIAEAHFGKAECLFDCLKEGAEGDVAVPALEKAGKEMEAFFASSVAEAAGKDAPATSSGLVEACFLFVCIFARLSQHEKSEAGKKELAKLICAHYNRGIRTAHALPRCLQVSIGAATDLAKRAGKYAGEANALLWDLLTQ
jgi:hypothetical protein